MSHAHLCWRLAPRIPDSDPVRRVSIAARGQSLGATVQAPVDDRMNYSADYLRGRITAARGFCAKNGSL